MSKLLDTVLVLNIIADLIMKFRGAGIEVTLENLDDVIKEREAKADSLDKQLGIID